MANHSDLTFITNERGQNLLERFKVLIKVLLSFHIQQLWTSSIIHPDVFVFMIPTTCGDIPSWAWPMSHCSPSSVDFEKMTGLVNSSDSFTLGLSKRNGGRDTTFLNHIENTIGQDPLLQSVEVTWVSVTREDDRFIGVAAKG